MSDKDKNRGSKFQDHLKSQLQDPTFASAYIQGAIHENDEEGIRIALGDVVRAIGVARVAELSGIPRPTIYQMLGENGNPSLESVQEILNACGLEISVLPRSSEKVANQESIHVFESQGLPRSTIVEKLWSYIMKNNLQDEVISYGEKELKAKADRLHKITAGKVSKKVSNARRRAKSR